MEALTTDVRAALIVALIQQLYEVERAGVDLATDARRDLRRAQSMPLLRSIAEERDQLARTVLPKSPLGDALRYLTNQWAALQRYVDDGRLESITIAQRTSCALSPLAGRTGCLPAVLRAPAAPRCSIPSSKAAS